MAVLHLALNFSSLLSRFSACRFVGGHDAPRVCYQLLQRTTWDDVPYAGVDLLLRVYARPLASRRRLIAMPMSPPLKRRPVLGSGTTPETVKEL